MTIRTRKLFGTIALLVLVVVWSLMGMTIAQTPWLANSGLLQAIFYVVAGLGWVLPAMPIVSWMSRPDRPRSKPLVQRQIVRVGRTGGNIMPGQHDAHHAQRTLSAVPGDARQRVEVGVPLRLDHTRNRRYRAGKAGLLRHLQMLPAPGFAVAERIGEMPDVAAKGGLGDRLAHRDLALRVGIPEVRQHGIIHRRAADRHQRIGRKLRQIVPVHRRAARQRREIDRIALAEIVDGERQIRRRQRPHPA